MRDSAPARLHPVPASPPSAEPLPGPVALVSPFPEPSTGRLLLLALAAVLLPRLLVMPLAENLYGDAVIRTQLAARWAADPHWIGSFGAGAFQFGPLQLYLVGLVLKLGVGQELAGRLVSLVFGTLSVVPLFLLSRRLFGWRAGAWACLAFSVWGMHIQMSTTAASEALALFLVLSALALFAQGLDENKFSPILLSALVLNLACATRYDVWLLIPLMTVLLLTGDEDRVAAITRGVLFALLCLPFPLIWMQGNEVAHGDPLYPIHFIEQFHRGWVASEVGYLSNPGFRLEGLVFWPGVALFTLTPGVAILGMVGMARTWKERPEHRWLLWICWAPTLYYAFKTAVLMNFVPAARFGATQVALLLPFVEPGFRALVGHASAARKRWTLVGAASLAVLLPLGLGVFTFQADGKLQTTLRPVSPITTNPQPVMQVASYLKHEAAPKGGSVILDAEKLYADLQIGFFSGLPESRVALRRSPDFRKRVAELKPEYLVRVEGGELDKELALSPDGREARLGDVGFVEQPGFSPPYHVYRRR